MTMDIFDGDIEIEMPPEDELTGKKSVWTDLVNSSMWFSFSLSLSTKNTNSKTFLLKVHFYPIVSVIVFIIQCGKKLIIYFSALV